jgi:isopenicillin-N epimerase
MGVSGDQWATIRDQWALDPSIVFLNHGSFGACPTPVLDHQQSLRRSMESDPMDFMERRLAPMMADALEVTAGFLGTTSDQLVFVDNATTAVNTILESIDFDEGEEVLITDHTYSGVFNSVATRAQKNKYRLNLVHVELGASNDDIVRSIEDAMTENTRLVVVDHISSSTAVVMPIDRIVTACKNAGKLVMVDAAHAPGMMPVDLLTLHPDYWTGNLHKWVCAPKGCGVMYVSKQRQEGVHPLVRSHDHLAPFSGEFGWQGTRDPTAYLTAPAAIEFMASIGWEDVWEHNNDLAEKGAELLSTALGTRRPTRKQRVSMSLVELPDHIVDTREQGIALRDELFRLHRIEVPVFSWGGRGFVRLSAQAYNRLEEYELLAEVLPSLIAGIKTPLGLI